MISKYCLETFICILRTYESFWPTWKITVKIESFQLYAFLYKPVTPGVPQGSAFVPFGSTMTMTILPRKFFFHICDIIFNTELALKILMAWYVLNFSAWRTGLILYQGSFYETLNFHYTFFLFVLFSSQQRFMNDFSGVASSHLTDEWIG